MQNAGYGAKRRTNVGRPGPGLDFRGSRLMLWIWGSTRFLSLLWPHVPFGPWHQMKLPEEMNGLAEEAEKVAGPLETFLASCAQAGVRDSEAAGGERVGVQTAHLGEVRQRMLSSGWARGAVPASGAMTL